MGDKEGLTEENICRDMATIFKCEQSIPLCDLIGGPESIRRQKNLRRAIGRYGPP